MRNVAGWPKYKCHKVVQAVKIGNMQKERRPGGAIYVIPADEGVPQFSISQEFFDKHNPEIGGYIVVYADGYESYSPAEVFEAGYTRLPDADKPNVPDEPVKVDDAVESKLKRFDKAVKFCREFLAKHLGGDCEVCIRATVRDGVLHIEPSTEE